MYYIRSALQRTFVSCLVAIVLYNAGASAEAGTTRIVGGSLITIDKAPYMMQLRRVNDGSFVCGATLVSPIYVVTAAHCMPGEDFTNLMAVGGATHLYDDGVQRKVIRVTVHPEYELNNRHTDVAVLKLIGPMQGENIQAVPLCGQALRPNQLVQVSGWGPTTKGPVLESGPMSDQLRTVRFPVRSKEDCEREYYRFVQKNMFCASGYEDKGLCRGDSGGPAIFNEQFCGINAFTWQCGMAGSSAAFTDVFALRSYIQSEMSY